MFEATRSQRLRARLAGFRPQRGDLTPTCPERLNRGSGGSPENRHLPSNQLGRLLTRIEAQPRAGSVVVVRVDRKMLIQVVRVSCCARGNAELGTSAAWIAGHFDIPG